MEVCMVVEEGDIVVDDERSLVRWVSWLMERHHALFLPYIISPPYPALYSLLVIPTLPPTLPVSGPLYPTALNVLLKPLQGLTSSQLVTAGRLSYAHEGRVDTNV
jgi:hypothetical protein